MVYDDFVRDLADHFDHEAGVTPPRKQQTAREAYEDTSRPLVERLIIEWQKLVVTPFRYNLWRAIENADQDELDKLALGFPEEVHAIRIYRMTWINKKLQEEGLL